MASGEPIIVFDKVNKWYGNAYLFITLIYFVFCFSMSRYSLWIEGQLARSKNR